MTSSWPKHELKNLNDDIDGHDGEVGGLREFELAKAGHRVPLEQRLRHERLVEVGEELEHILFFIYFKVS